MDTDTHHFTESWFMRLGENTVHWTVTALVLTGQLLPAGAVSAQEEPAPPAAVSPDQLPALPMLEPSIPPPAPLPERLVEQAATAEATEAAQPAAAPVLAVQEKAPVPTLAEEAPPPKDTHQIGDWTMTIRPGIFPAKPAPPVPDPCDLALAPQANVSVPVTINVHHHESPTPYQSPWMWSVPATYPTQWNAPTSAYLFQRPRPYWKLRGDFHHLAPFIPGYWF